MKRFTDQISPGRWKRICAPPDDSDSESSLSSASSHESVRSFFRRLYSFEEYDHQSNCYRCAAPVQLCVCQSPASPDQDPTGSGNNNNETSSRMPLERRSSFQSQSGTASEEPSATSSTASVSFRASTSLDTTESSSTARFVRLSAAISRSMDRTNCMLQQSSSKSNADKHSRRADLLKIEPLVLVRGDATASTSAAEAATPYHPSTSSATIREQQQPEDEESEKQDDGRTELDHFHAKLIGLIECPVCLEPISPPIHQCRRGHLLCAKCKSQLSQCPTCRDRLSDMRNWAVERLVEHLRYPCRNASSGCTVTTLLSERPAHELSCPFRHYSCLFRTCSWTGFQPEMIPHLRTAHPLRFLEGSRQQIDVEMNSPTLFYTDWAISCFGQVFRFNVFQHIPNSMFYASAYLVGGANESQTAQYTYTVTVNGCLGRRVSFTRQTHPETTRTSQLCHSEDCFSIRGDKLEHFAQSCGKLRLHLELENLIQ